MKFCTLLLPLLAITLAVGCNPSQPTKTPGPERSTQRSSGDDDVLSVLSVKDSPHDATAKTTSDKEVVQADIRTNLNAVYAGDVETVLGYTHPKIIEMMGGRTQAKAALGTALSKNLAIGMTLESLAFHDDPTFLTTELNHFVIVPTKSIITANGQRVESLNYQFGIKAVGTSRWTYIEGSRINKQNVRTLFPDFPSDFEFPEFYRKKL